MGYQVVEFYAPYLQWTPETAKERPQGAGRQRAQVPVDAQQRARRFTPDGLKKAIELNQIIGSKYIIMASAPRATVIDDWKGLGDQLTAVVGAAQAARDGDRVSQSPGRMAPAGRPASDGRDRREHAEGRRAAVRRRHLPRGRRRPDCLDQREPGTDQERALQGLGGRHAATTSPSAKATRRGRRSSTPSRSTGGVEYYLIEQETGAQQDGELPMVQRCLDNWKKLRGA